MSGTHSRWTTSGAATWLSSLMLCACILRANSAAAQLRIFKVGPGSQVQFVSDAPLERITGSTSQVSGEIRVDPAAPRAARARISVPVASIRTNNDLRDEHLRSDNWLDAAGHPTIEVVVTDVTGIDALVPETAQDATVTAKLTVHGVTQDVSTRARVRFSPASTASQEGDALRVQARFVVKLGNHKVSIPSIVSLKVSPNIQVNVDLRGRAQPVVVAPVDAVLPPSAIAPPVPQAASRPEIALIEPKQERRSYKAPKGPTTIAGSRRPERSHHEESQTEAAYAGAQSEGPVRERPSAVPVPASQVKPPPLAPQEGVVRHVQRLRALMRQTRKSLAANDVEQAEKLVRTAQSVLAHIETELVLGPVEEASRNPVGALITPAR